MRRLRAALILVVLAGLGTWLLVGHNGEEPRQHAARGPVVFEDPEDLLYSNLYVADLRSGRLTQLTRNDGEERVVTDPAWTPDGRSLVYAQVPCDDCPAVLEHVAADGSTRPRRVAAGSHPSVLPDGRRMTFTGRSGGLYLARLDGSGRRRIESPQRTFSEPTLSPDGRQVAAVVQAPDGRMHVAVVDLRGRLRHVLPAVGRSVVNPAWAPGGGLAFSAMRADGRWAVVSMRPDGRGRRRLTGAGSDTAPSFSPDGRRMVFVRDEGDRPTLLIARSDGSGARPLLGRRLVGYQPVFSPDGSRVAFVVHRGMG